MYRKLIMKKEHGLKLERNDIDFNDLEQIVTVNHINPIFRKHLCTFKTKLKYYIFGAFLCPECNPELTSEYGKEIFREMYKNDIEKEDCIINGVQVDFLLKDGHTCLKYFGLEYFKNHTKYNQLAEEIINVFEKDDNYTLIIMDYNDLEE